MIYLPNIDDYECFVVQNDTTIRAYENMPTQNNSVNYRDYYITANYIYKEGTQQFNQYATLPICLDSNVVTDNVYYRNDFDSILIIFLILSFFCFYLPIKLFSKLLKRVRT